jgi:hypothetical protein
MTEPIRVDLARECDLLEVGRHLGACGFTAHRIEIEDAFALEVTSLELSHGSLAVDVWNALAVWLETADRPLVPRVVAEREYALTPPGD